MAMRRTRAMLAPWHLDPDPSNAMAETLDALCRTHHPQNDAPEHGHDHLQPCGPDRREAHRPDRVRLRVETGSVG